MDYKCKHLSTLKGMEGEIKMNDLFKKSFCFFEEPEDKGGDNPKDEPKDKLEDKKKEEAIEEKKYSDKEVDDIINAKFAKWQKDQEEKIKEAEKLAKMDEDEKAEHEKKTLLDKIKEYEEKEQLEEMAKTAKSMLKEKNIEASDDILGFLVTKKAEKTSKNVNAFAELIETEREAIRTEYEKKLGIKVPVGSNESIKLSEGERLAKERNEQRKKKTDTPDPWATN